MPRTNGLRSILSDIFDKIEGQLDLYAEEG